MYKIGDIIIYSTHGLCQIDDISEKTFSGVTKTYYVFHPINNEKLEISTPVTSKSISVLIDLDKKETNEILNLFTQPGTEWIDKIHHRTHAYSEIAKSGNRKEYAKLINTLMVKKYELELNKKKFAEQDRIVLTSMQNILFEELAQSLNTTFEKVVEKVEGLLDIYEEESVVIEN